MSIEPENLSKHDYELEHELAHNNLLPFIMEQIKGWALYAMLYKVALLLFGTLLIVWMVVPNDVGQESIMQRLPKVGYGISLAMLLIPVHEIVHGIAYKYVGARHISYVANWKKLYFMAVADKYVADLKSFRVLALAPFVVITILLLIVGIILPAKHGVWIWSCLFTHTYMCIGDFGLLNFMEKCKQASIVTYDDMSQQITYFYIKGSNHTQAATA